MAASHSAVASHVERVGHGHGVIVMLVIHRVDAGCARVCVKWVFYGIRNWSSQPCEDSYL